ncbi:uncharacterized protein DS421_12g373180 [Arachis hypogaea]|nr:uncharacterized protein DS421_12g373180 [Arachis hypogaea]
MGTRERNIRERGESVQSATHNRARARGRAADDETGTDGWSVRRGRHGCA